jgi:sterol desaturase/sphingolipid hydroxylase (fatty acid hydroxylase superfamily)
MGIGIKFNLPILMINEIYSFSIWGLNCVFSLLWLIFEMWSGWNSWLCEISLSNSRSRRSCVIIILAIIIVLLQLWWPFLIHRLHHWRAFESITHTKLILSVRVERVEPISRIVLEFVLGVISWLLRLKVKEAIVVFIIYSFAQIRI